MMSEVKMSDVFVLLISSFKGDLFHSKNPLFETRFAKFFYMNQHESANAVKVAVNSYDSNQELIAKLQRDMISHAVDLEYARVEGDKQSAQIKQLREKIKLIERIALTSPVDKAILAVAKESLAATKE